MSDYAVTIIEKAGRGRVKAVCNDTFCDYERSEDSAGFYDALIHEATAHSRVTGHEVWVSVTTSKHATITRAILDDEEA